jgi:hypothetical protein
LDETTDGGRPTALVGTWRGVYRQMPTIEITLQLSESGDDVETLAATDCGPITQTWSNGTWSATANSLAFGGTPACSGALTCTATCVNSNPLGPLGAGPFSYQVSGDCNTLTINTAYVLTLTRN